MTVFGEDSSDKEEVDRIAKETELDGKSLKIYFDFPAEYQRLERMVK